MSRVPLREIAHARAGDKGDISSIGVFVNDPRHYAAVKRQLMPERLKATFGGVLKGPIRRYSIDHLCALNFVMEQALEGRGQRIPEPRFARQVLELSAARPADRAGGVAIPGPLPRARSPWSGVLEPAARLQRVAQRRSVSRSSIADAKALAPLLVTVSSHQAIKPACSGTY